MEPTQRFGRYELLSTLGRGGMAELWLARLVGVAGFTKLVAIKRILPHLSDDPEFVRMFLREGKVAAKLSHPNVCSVYELGEVDGQLFLAMEYLEGVSWERLLTALPRGDAARLRVSAGVLGQACDGLHYAHELIVHRDVSPQNLFVTVDGVCKVLDFGVAKVMSEGAQTHTGMLKGKLPYMSPEQIVGTAVDARSDVFAIGILLWEALTGERLFLRDNDYQIWKAVTEMPIPRVSERAPIYGAEVDAVVARALERDPVRRYPTIAELGEELRAVARRFGGAAGTSELGAAIRAAFADELEQRERLVSEASGRRGEPRAPGRPDEPTAPAGAEPPPNTLTLRRESVAITRRRRMRWLTIAALGVFAMAGVIVYAAHDRAPTDTVPAAALRSPTASVASGAADTAPVEAAPNDPDVEIDDVPHPQPPARHPTVHRATGDPGFFSVDSTPYATIFIDGKRQDQTPLFHVPLPPGHHRVLAVLADGRKRSFTIKIDPGVEATSGTLSW